MFLIQKFYAFRQTPKNDQKKQKPFTFSKKSKTKNFVSITLYVTQTIPNLFPTKKEKGFIPFQFYNFLSINVNSQLRNLTH